MHLLFCFMTCLVVSTAALTAAFGDATVTLCHEDVQSGPGRNLATALQIGGQIRFACPPGTRIRITREHFILSMTEVDGENKVTLDAQDTTNMFRAVSGGDVFTLRNIALRRGRATPGRPAMIWGVMETVLDHVEVSNSEKPVAIQFRKITVINSNFFTNTGPVLDAPNLDVRKSRFVGTIGSAMQAIGGRIVLDGVQVAGNRALTDKGSFFDGCSLDIRNSQFFDLWTTFSALECHCGKINITDTSFTNNRGNSGGGLYLGRIPDDVELRSVTFSNNEAKSEGGAIFIDEPVSNARTVRVIHGIFRNNRAQWGGAIALFPGTSLRLNVLESHAVSFKGNIATGKGGAIFGKHASIKLARAILVDNQASVGSAIMLEGDAAHPFLLANALVARNKGAGAAVQGDLEGQIVNSTIADNDAGGLASTRRVEITNTVLSTNRDGNCQFTGPSAALVNRGANVQFPRTDCGAAIPMSDPQLDSFFVPALDSVLQRAGNNATCLAQPVNARDVYGQRRPRTDRCTIGAVEGDIEHLVRKVKRTDRKREPR